MNNEPPESHGTAHTVAFLLAFLVGLVFLPLIIALFEHYILRSDHFEDYCRRVGVHNILDRVYAPVVKLFK